jgi:protein MpaA
LAWEAQNNQGDMKSSLVPKVGLNIGTLGVGILLIFSTVGCQGQNPNPEPILGITSIPVGNQPVVTTAPTFEASLPPSTPTHTSSAYPHTKTPKSTSTPITPNITSTYVRLEPRPTVIGYSVKGQSIEVYRFGFGTKERMIVAGVHGGYEWNTISLADELIEYLSDHPEVIPSGKRLFILRSLNPDGETRSNGIKGRANENGVDINRNFPAYWQVEWNPDGCWNWLPISAGPHPSSEPETQALMKFIQTHRIEALISYHSAGLGIFPGGRPPDPASVSLAVAIGGVSSYPYPPISGGCEFTGQMADWMSEQDIAAVDIELTNHEDTDFEQSMEILDVFLNWEP